MDNALREAIEYCERLLDGPHMYSGAQWRDTRNGARRALRSLGERSEDEAIKIVAQKLSGDLGMDQQELERQINAALGS
jgi:hypothetical protein